MNYIGMKVSRQLTVRDENGDLVSPTPAPTFKWRSGETGTVTDGEVTEISTGMYEVTFTPLIGGLVYYRWDTEGDTDVAKEGRLFVKPSAFEVSA